MSENIKSLTIKGVKWSAVDTFSIRIIQFLVSLVLARLLTPADYGTVGMVAIFFAISNVFIQCGFGSALIRKQNCTEQDINTVFHFNVVVSFICYWLLFFASPFIADFFKMPALRWVVRTMALNLIIGSFGSIQYVLFHKKVDFKSTAIASFTSAIVSGFVGITLALLDFGVWALVGQGLVATITSTSMLYILSTWRPSLMFSWKSFRELFSFGGKLLVQGVIWEIYNNLADILIGKFYSSATLGYYSRGRSYASLPASTSMNILQRVTYPILAKIQDDEACLISAYRKYISITSMVIFFGMGLLIALARPIILFTVTEKWVDAIPYLQICALFLMFDHINAINLNLLLVKGRSDLTLRLEIIKRVISFAILLISIRFGVMAMCWGFVVNTQIAIILNTYYNGKLFGFGYFRQLRDFLPYLLKVTLACVPAYLVTLTSSLPIIQILVGTVLSALFYYGILYVTHDVYVKEYITDGLFRKILYTRFKFNQRTR